MNIVYSKRKTLAIEVKRDQSVIVRAPQGFPPHKIQQFIEDTRTWVLKKKQSLAVALPAEPLWLSDAERIQAETCLTQLFEQCWQHCLHWPYSKPQLRLKEMKSRWGSYSPRSHSITLNTFLIKAPTACIVDVIMHELCHLKHQNHGKRFHRLLEKMAPGWRSRTKGLRLLGATDKIADDVA